MKMPQMIAATKITNTTMKKMFAPHLRPGSMNVEKNLSAEVTFSVGVAVFDVFRLMMAEPSSRRRVEDWGFVRARTVRCKVRAMACLSEYSLLSGVGVILQRKCRWSSVDVCPGAWTSLSRSVVLRHDEYWGRHLIKSDRR